MKIWLKNEYNDRTYFEELKCGNAEWNKKLKKWSKRHSDWDLVEVGKPYKNQMPTLANHHKLKCKVCNGDVLNIQYDLFDIKFNKIAVK